jgi:hypothetical protein
MSSAATHVNDDARSTLAESTKNAEHAIKATETAQPAASPSQPGGQTLLTGSKLLITVLSLYSCMFLVALDQLILSKYLLSCSVPNLMCILFSDVVAKNRVRF